MLSSTCFVKPLRIEKSKRIIKHEKSGQGRLQTTTFPGTCETLRVLKQLVRNPATPVIRPHIQPFQNGERLLSYLNWHLENRDDPEGMPFR